MTFEIRDATEQDLNEFYVGARPNVSMQAKAGVLDGVVVVVGGIFLDQGRCMAFIDTTPQAETAPRYARKLIKACNEMMDYARSKYQTVLVTARDECIAPGFLKHYGFKPYAEWAGKSVYRWRRFDD